MITDDSYSVIQKLGGDHMRVVQIRKGNNVLIEKLRFRVEDAVGARYGLFEVLAGGKLRPTSIEDHNQLINNQFNQEENEKETDTNDTVCEDAESLTSNIYVNDVVDDNDSSKNEAQRNQVVSTDEIKALKESGVGTSGLVSRLADGNRLFGDKTIFSQKKYLRKKAIKHSDRILIMKPTIRLLSEAYYKRDPDRIGHLRLDLLGLVLQLSGARSGSCIFVYEQVLGLLGASFIQRLGGFGKCVFLHRGQVPDSIPSIHAMEFSEEQMKVFWPVCIDSLLKNNQELESSNVVAKKMKCDQSIISEETSKIVPEKVMFPKNKTGVEVSSNGDVSKMDVENDAFEPNGSEKIRKPTNLTSVERFDRQKRALNCLNSTNEFDSICLAIRTINPVEILEISFDSLCLSGTIVIYSALLQHIIDAHEWLYAKGVINLQICDQFYREYQVLPGSTHPLMQQNVTGGFVLSGIKVQQKKN